MFSPRLKSALAKPKMQDEAGKTKKMKNFQKILKKDLQKPFWGL
jgi:hypothetical protein